MSRRIRSATVTLVLFFSPMPSWTEEGHVRLADGQRIYYEVSGDGCPVVLVSGGSGMDLRQWDDAFSRLSERFKAVRYDPRGLGRSDIPTEPYSDAADLTSLLDDLDIEKAALVAVSSAGGFALEYSLEAPERTLGLVVSAPFVPGYRFSDEMAARVARFATAAQDGREPFLDAMLSDPHFIPSPLRPEIRSRVRRNMGENYDKASMLDPNLERPFDPPLIERLGEISVPVLLVEGALDHPDVHQRNRFLRDGIRGSRIARVEDAGHNPPLENPEVFVKSIVPTLESVCQGR